MKFFHVRIMLSVCIVEYAIELHPLGNQLGQNVLPFAEFHSNAWLLIPPIGKHLGVDSRMGFDDDVQVRLVLLQRRIDNSQTKANIHNALSLGTIRRDYGGMSIHQRTLPFHHDGIVVVIQK